MMDHSDDLYTQAFHDGYQQGFEAGNQRGYYHGLDDLVTHDPPRCPMQEDCTLCAILKRLANEFYTSLVQMGATPGPSDGPMTYNAN